MTKKNTLKVLIIAPYYNLNVPGECWSTYKWIEGISEFCDTTVLTCHHAGWDSTLSPTSAQIVVNWTDPNFSGINERLIWELKPGYFFFHQKARRWIKKSLQNGLRFDLAHQISPLALRYPSPLHSFGIPYVIGPLAGSLKTPEGFKDASIDKHWFRRLRSLDRLRIAYDPWLRRSYSDASAIIGVAPYVRDLLDSCRPHRFAIMAETGVVSVASQAKRPPIPDEPLRLLFVGRIIRTKGIIDAIRAIAICSKTIKLRFDVIGDGDLLDACMKEAENLSIADRVFFHGRQSKEEVFKHYERSHVFLFPSFREPSGNVVFEAMSHGLPVITSNIGGPGYVVDDTSGIRVSPIDPDSYAIAIANAILHTVESPEVISNLSAGALRRMNDIALWPNKIKTMVDLYHEVMSSNRL